MDAPPPVDPTGPTEPSPGQSDARGLLRAAGTTVIPLVIAVTSLLFSMFTWWATNRPPDVALGAPSVVRIVQAGDAAWMYVQPHLIVGGTTDRVAVVSGLGATVTPVGGGDPVAFTWEERGTWAYDPGTQALTWEFDADPSPLLVSASTPQSPVALMVSDTEMPWRSGSYDVVVVATPADGDPVRAAFVIDVDERTAAQLAADPGRFLEVPVRTASG